jgi:cation:H+ antiporter
MLYLMILAGFAMLAAGGETLVRGAIGTARALGLSPLLIGLLLVGFGTSMPELVTSLYAAIHGSPGIAIGSVVGSNIANILLILGVAALARPLVVNAAAFRRDGPMLLGATLALVFAVPSGSLERWLGAFFLGSLLVYVCWVFLSERNATPAEIEMREHIAEDAPSSPHRIGISLALAGGGMALTLYGARVLVDNAVLLAQQFGVSDTVVGLTIVAIGTSLPELVATVIAALRGHADVALGNVIGSSIYNLLGILGMTAVVHPISVPIEIAQRDIWVLLATTVLLIAAICLHWKLQRWKGAVFVALYLGYLGYQFV